MLTSGVAGSDPFESARQRALVLAASGDHLLWPNIAQVLASEGFSVAAIKLIGKDRASQREITTRIHAVETALLARQSPTETRRTRWRRNG